VEYFKYDFLVGAAINFCAVSSPAFAFPQDETVNYKTEIINPIKRLPIPKWSSVVLVVLAICSLGLSSASYASPQQIRPGVLWYDTDANIISAHGGGIIKLGDTYYWFGEYKDSDPNNLMNAGMGHVTHQFVAIPCYSSTDFVNWTFENNVLTQQPSGDLGPGRVVERPKVIYNDLNDTYVMYMHIDNAKYDEAKYGVATCSTVNGDYTYLGSYQPPGGDSRDMTLFKDDDGKGYLITHDSLTIYRLTSNYLSVDAEVVDAAGQGEAPAMLKANGTYYLFFSGKSWWQSNDNSYSTAPAIEGPWTSRGDFTPNSRNTWNSQTTFVQAIQGIDSTTYVFMGDRWCEGCFGDSVYIWLPLKINGTTVTLDWYDSWTLDANTGAWAPVPPPGTVLLYDGFEAAVWDANFNDIPHNWLNDTGEFWRDSNSAWADKDNNGDFICNALDTSDANVIHVDFWFRKDDTDANGRSGGPDFFLYYYNGTNYNLIADLDTLGDDDEWLNYTDTITDSNFFVPGFKIRFNAALEQNENVWIDEVVITKELPVTACDAANLDGVDPVDFKDFSILGDDWLLTGSSLAGDIDANDVVNLDDLDWMFDYWLNDCGQ